MVQKRETTAINKLCVREILSLSFVYGAYFFEFRGRNLVCFVIAYNFNGKYAPEAGKTRMRTAFFTRAITTNVSDKCCELTYLADTMFKLILILSSLSMSPSLIIQLRISKMHLFRALTPTS